MVRAVQRLLLILVLLLPSTASAQLQLPYPSWLRLDDAAPGGFSSDPATPLSARAQRIANDVPDEGTPNPGEHYPISNEFSHQLWFDHIRDLGGAFVGVGTDQCYTLAAVQNASMLWVVDFDPLVPVVHRIYSALVPAAETPEALVAYFDPAHRDATLALIGERLAGQADVAAVQRAFRRNHSRMHEYLQRVLRNRRGGVAASWLSDPVLYARIRALFSSGRVVARNGDVTADGAMRAVGRAARELGVTVRVIYFSNAEQFFPFTRDYRLNVEGLPTDERTVVLRTFREAGVPYPPGERWHYMVHPLSDMRARVMQHGYRHSRQLVRDLMQRGGRYLGADGVSVLDGNVPRRFGTDR